MVPPQSGPFTFLSAVADHLEVVRLLVNQLPVLESIAEQMFSALSAGHKVFWCGNGGSAADSQHLAAELVGRYRRERKAVGSVALTTDTSVITAIANDYGYDQVFRRQVEALVSEGDIVVGISTSGNSRNVYLALELARSLGALTVVLTGGNGGDLLSISDFSICVESRSTARIQEAHILCGHMLCDYIEYHLCEQAKVQARVMVVSNGDRL